MEGAFSKQKIEIFFFGNLKANTFPKVKHFENVENIHLGINFATAFFSQLQDQFLKCVSIPFTSYFLVNLT